MSSLRELSKSLFGNKYRLELAAGINRASEVFHAKDLERALGIAHNVITSQLNAWAEAGVLTKLEAIEGQKHRYYRRERSPYWAMAEQLHEAVLADVHEPVGERE